MTQIAIIGAAGLSGLELLRILKKHPHITLGPITSSRYAGRALGEVFSEFASRSEVFCEHEQADLSTCKLVFLAIPNQASLNIVPRLLQQGLRVIDLSGVFRLRDNAVFKRFYGLEHKEETWLKQAVFGLPEASRKHIAKATLLANPGCYPTGAMLGLLPLGKMARNLSAPPIIDAKSGVSGAGGRVEDDSTNFMTVYENFKAYKVMRHQHFPEIVQCFEEYTPYRSKTQGDLVFTPHLLPIARGILSTIYLRFSRAIPAKGMRQHFLRFAKKEPFVTLLEAGRDAELGMVQHSNNCMISLHPSADERTWVIVTAIDNLVKGAAGQAVQNMNLMLGFEETTALT